MTFGTGHHLHLIDGSAYIFRAYHALPPLTRKSDGLPVGAVAGFCNILWNELSRASAGKAATHLAVVFDHSATTFRNALYPQYKANRPDLPEDLRPQFPLTREATRAFNVACLETEGYEADDIIAALSCRAVEAGGSCTIISSDKDLMQLIRPGVDMFDPMKSRQIGPDEVLEKFGVPPDRVIDVQSLAGDSVDNVPGAPGIGLKTAALLIQEYGDLDTLLARAHEIRQPKRREALIDNAEQIRISRQLVTLDCDTPLDVTKAESLPFDLSAYECVRDLAALDRWIARIQEVGHVAVDTETTSLDEMRAELVGISLAVDAGQACYIPVGHTTGGGDLFGATALAPDQLPMEAVLQALRPVLQDPAILKIGQNMKYDWKIFARLGIRISPFDDTLLMSYAMHAGLHNHGMDELSDRYLVYQPVSIKTLLGSGKSQITFDRVAIDAAVKYAAEDADVTLRLWQTFKPQLHRARVTTVYETLERPLVPVLADMEMAGIQIDRDTLRGMSNVFAQKLVQLEEEIHGIAGEKFNVGSPKQLGEILFDRLQIPGGTKGKTDAYGTGADILEDITTL
ncbi:MAG: DNA polymerase I, partial [Rhodobacterales bacterium 32-66-9]